MLINRSGFVAWLLVYCVGGIESRRLRRSGRIYESVTGSLSASSPEHLTTLSTRKSVCPRGSLSRMHQLLLDEQAKVQRLEAVLASCLQGHGDRVVYPLRHEPASSSRVSRHEPAFSSRVSKRFLSNMDVKSSTTAAKRLKSKMSWNGSESAAVAALSESEVDEVAQKLSLLRISDNTVPAAAETAKHQRSKEPSSSTTQSTNATSFEREASSDTRLRTLSEETLSNISVSGAAVTVEKTQADAVQGARKGKGKGCPPPLPPAGKASGKGPPHTRDHRLDQSRHEAGAAETAPVGVGKLTGKGSPPPPPVDRSKGKGKGKGKTLPTAGAKALNQTESMLKSTLALARGANLELSLLVDATAVLDLLELDRSEYLQSLTTLTQKATHDTNQSTSHSSVKAGRPLQKSALPSYTSPVLKRLNGLQLGVAVQNIVKAMRNLSIATFDDVFDCVLAEDERCVGGVFGLDSTESPFLAQLHNVLHVVSDADLDEVRGDTELELAKARPEEHRLRFSGLEEVTAFIWMLASRLPDGKSNLMTQLECLAKRFDVSKWLHYARKIASTTKAYYRDSSAKRLLFLLDAALTGEIAGILAEEETDSFKALPEAVRNDFKTMDRLLMDVASAFGYRQPERENAEATWINSSVQDAFVPFLYTANVLAKKGNHLHFASKYVNLIPRLAPSHIDMFLLFAAHNGFKPGTTYSEELQSVCSDVLEFVAPIQPSEGISGMLEKLYELHKDPMVKCRGSKKWTESESTDSEWAELTNTMGELVGVFEELFDTVMSTVGPLTRELLAHMIRDGEESSVDPHAKLREAAVTLPKRMVGSAWGNPVEPTVDWPFASLWDDFSIRVNLQKFCRRLYQHQKSVIGPRYFRVRGDSPGSDLRVEKARNPTAQ